jgi:hypothetical protein
MSSQTAAARRTVEAEQRVGATVFRRDDLVRRGCTRSELTARIAARRWQRIGRAIVLHAGPLTRRERCEAAILNCGPRSALTSFTGLEDFGLVGWQRDEIHVLTARGARVGAVQQLGIRRHVANVWRPHEVDPRRRHRVTYAAAVAAGSLDIRSGCALLAAVVQQRLATADNLARAVSGRPRLRHRALLLRALDDIAMGAQALSEIDFARLCRTFHLPAPEQQTVRTDPSGRRRYLDASWRRADGRLVAVEVDGALHLTVANWWGDQSRQNELVLSDVLVLRFPSIVVRLDAATVARQLRRALQL